MSERAEEGAYSVRLRPDSKGRITLGKLADGVSSYRARRQKDGKILLEPFIEIPAEERWVYENPDILAAIKRGLADSKAGRVTRMSFKKYLK
jgi:predicted transcriptional regulator